MGYGALSTADYFDVNLGDANPKVYAFKQGRNGWNATAASYPNTKPLGSSAVTPGTYSITSSFLPTTGSCTGTTPDSELVRCVGFAAIAGASSGLGAWLVGSDASYRPVDIRETVLSGEYIYDNSSAVYSFNIPFKDLFKADTDGDLVNDYNNLKKLDPAFSGTSKYVFYNRTQHTGIMAGMGGRMLGYDTVGMRNGLPEWNNTVGEKFMGSTVGTLMLSQATGSIYAGTISTLYPANSGLNLAPTITSGPSVAPIGDTTATITRSTDYPATSQVLYSAILGGPYTKVNDTVLNTSHSVALSGLTAGTTYYYKAVSYDCVANKVESSEGGFTTLPPSCVPSAEVCDGVDNDCNGLIDDGIPSTPTSCGVGACASTGTLSCVGGVMVDSCTPGTPSAEIPCNGIDDNCNGAVDEVQLAAFSIDKVSMNAQFTGPSGDVFSISTMLPVDGALATYPFTNAAGVGILMDWGAEYLGTTDKSGGVLSDIVKIHYDTLFGTPFLGSEGQLAFDGHDKNGNVLLIDEVIDYTSPTFLTRGWILNTFMFPNPVVGFHTEQGRMWPFTYLNGAPTSSFFTLNYSYPGTLPIAPTTCGTGACSATGTSSCVDGVLVDSCTPGTPSTETCNSIDDDCNGAVDDGIAPVPTTCGVGACARTGELICQNGQLVDNCQPGQPQEEICDTVDNNCNGSVDENYVFGGFQQPINADGSSIFKAGSMISVKVVITDCSGQSISTATVTIAVNKITDAVLGTVEELQVESSGSANTGNLFRYDATAGQYLFNLSTKGYTAGTYKIYAKLDDGKSYSVNVSLK